MNYFLSFVLYYLVSFFCRGIEPSSSAADVKKAYRKAALRHHPDKVSGHQFVFFNFCVPYLIFVTHLSLQAGQFLVRNENLDDGVWREVFAEVHADADRLFKMIGEAYTILSDPTKVYMLMNPEF